MNPNSQNDAFPANDTDDRLRRALQQLRDDAKSMWRFQIGLVAVVLLCFGVAAYSLRNFDQTRESVNKMRTDSEKVQTDSTENLEKLKISLGKIDRVPKTLVWVKFDGNRGIDNHQIDESTRKVWFFADSYNVDYVERQEKGVYVVYLKTVLPNNIVWIPILDASRGKASTSLSPVEELLPDHKRITKSIRVTLHTENKGTIVPIDGAVSLAIIGNYEADGTPTISYRSKEPF